MAKRPEQQGPASLLDMPEVTPDAVGSFFDAAALYYEQTPWRKTGERPIKVTSSQFASGPWYAVVLGEAGIAKGLILYDDLKTVQRHQTGISSPEENARRTAALVVMFGEKEDIPLEEVEAGLKHGGRVAGPRAFPWAYRMEPGLSLRPPLAWELTLLEGCLRALPEFVRKKTRRLEPLTISVPVASGLLPLVLSWADPDEEQQS